MPIEGQDIAADEALRTVEGQPAGTGFENQGAGITPARTSEGQTLPRASNSEGQNLRQPEPERFPQDTNFAPPFHDGPNDTPQSADVPMKRTNF
jgi:hypothetical protein